MSDRTLRYYQEDEIKELLLYRKVVRVEGYTMWLDNGVELEIEPNEGCGGCNSGWYELVELNTVDNAITNVEFICEDGDDLYDTSYKIFVYAEDNRFKLLQVDGTDGNGYYGTGYYITVKVK